MKSPGVRAGGFFIVETETVPIFPIGRFVSAYGVDGSGTRLVSSV